MPPGAKNSWSEGRARDVVSAAGIGSGAAFIVLRRGIEAGRDAGVGVGENSCEVDHFVHERSKSC